MRDEARITLIDRALQEHSLDAVVCALPLNVLLLSGYWPVVGKSIAIAFSRGPIVVLAPQDEENLARCGWADDVISFRADSLKEMTSLTEEICKPLRAIAGILGSGFGRIGVESGQITEPASYANIHLYGDSLKSLLQRVFASSIIASADDLLSELRAIQTGGDLNRIRAACALAERAFRQGSLCLRPGLTEVEIAARFREPLSVGLADFPEITRADGFVYCMSGPNSALASGAYAQSRARHLEIGDLVLIHCNSYADGYWTDITRTYHLGPLDDRERTMYAAISEARAAALRVIRPGVRAEEIDAAAREVLTARGFGAQFKHGTGHGVSLSAISADTRPRLHPKSPDFIQAGMVFNVEPAIYIDGYGGIRHCDMVAVNDSRAELLTPFQCALDDLVVLAN